MTKHCLLIAALVFGAAANAAEFRSVGEGRR
jgi:hypothetical protein